MSRFSQFVTSSARFDTVSVKSIKRILGGIYLDGAEAFRAKKLLIMHD